MLITASESDTAGRKFFLSREDGQWGSAPALSVTYTDRPPVSQAVSPAAGAVLVTSTPTLVSTSVTDPDGPVKYWFRVATDPSGEANVVANSGWVSSPSWQVPDRVLNDGQTYYWRVWTMDTLGALRAPGWVQSLRVNMRLGIDSTQTYDTFGPVSVNQATGNLVTSDAIQSMTAVGGQAGLSFSYNIKAPDQGGLTGKYYNYSGGFPPPSFTSEGPATVRTDSTLWFNWAPNPPAEGVSATSFMARWDGFFTAPVTGYYIGSGVAGGNKVWLNNVAVVNRWDQIQYWNTCAGPCWDDNASVHLNAGQQVPVVVQYYANAGGMINVYYKVRDAAGGGGNEIVPPSALAGEHLSVGPRLLPQGWGLSVDIDGELSYVSARISADSIVLVDATGATTEYRWNGSGWVPPVGEDDGVVAKNADGTVTLQAIDGSIYLFNADGTLSKAWSAPDDRKPAALSYAYTTVSNVPRLASITDPVSGRTVTPFYQGDPACTAPDGGWGFDAAPPAGMLCGVGFWDASSARLWYVNGRLGRVETNIDSTAPPGSQATVKTDYAYDANGRLVQIRDPLAADAVMAGVRSDTETVTAVTYDTSGRVASVELPAPTVGASRPKHTYEYHVDNPGVCPEAGNDCTLMHTVGLTEPLGWTQRVDHDSSYRTIRVTDATGVATTQVWDAPDRLLSSTDGAGRMTTTIYDDRDQPVDTYGPAPGCWFGTDRRPLPDGTTPPGGCTPLPAANAFTSATPRTHTGYDEAIVSLAGTWYANKNLTGSPVLHSTGVGETSGAIWKTWAGSPPAGVPAGEWGLRLTGDIDLAVAGSYQVRVFSDDGARVWIDDKVVLDDWTAGAQRWHPDSTPGRRHGGCTTVCVRAESARVPGWSWCRRGHRYGNHTQ